MANIVITGAAQGIGLMLSQEAIKSGHRVMAIVRGSSRRQELEGLMGQSQGRLEISEVDLYDEQASEKIQNSLKHWPVIDMLINNAGVYAREEALEDFLKSFQLNSVVPFLLTKALLPQLKKASVPKALHISSLMGSIAQNTSGGYHPYRASKAALNMISKGLSVDEPWLISAVFHPGWVRTRMGGEMAPLLPEDSARGLWRVFQELQAGDSGKFFDYQGNQLPW